MFNNQNNHFNFNLNRIIFIDIIVLISFILSFIIFRKDLVVIFVFLFLFFYLYFTSRSNRLYYLILSFFLSFFWMSISYEIYGYNNNFMTIFGFNSFPLFAWASGLFLIYIFNYYIVKYFKIINPFFIFLTFTFFYLLFLFSVETIGYHYLGIKNEFASSYPGLFICDCIHGPLWIQISYILLGPIYYLLCRLFYYYKKLVKSFFLILKHY
jgi:hypothetical protein